MQRSMLLLCVLLLACAGVFVSPARAGGGPAGFLVLYDQDDPVSVAVANHYQQVRDISERNMLPVHMPDTLNSATGWALLETLRAAIAERGLAAQLQGIAVAGYAPLGAPLTNGMMSLACILYNAPNFTKQEIFPTAGNNAAYRVPPATPSTIALSAATTFNGQSYWPASHVGPTDRAALSLRAALDSIDHARAADGARPDGIIYWPLNGDIRSTTREQEISEVIPLWEQMGVKYSILDGVWVKGRADIAGGVVGIASTDVAQDNHYLPGAWVDHLTSFGGVLVDNWQMPCTDFLLAGAAGSAGTMAEPYAIAGKFPHANIYTHFRNGASLAESFWESIQMLNEILPVGDPLLQPYAVFPRVSITRPQAGATVHGTARLHAEVAGVPVEATLDLFVDGRLVKIGDAAEPVSVKITRSPGDFALDTKTLADGWHDVRVVAYRADAVRTQGEAVLPLLVDNHHQCVTLRGPARVSYDTPTTFMVGVSQLTPASVALRANGRELATAPAGGLLKVPARAFPCTGACTVYPVATLADGSRVYGAPLTVTVDWPGLPATAAPALAPGAARMRYFADTSAKDFSWEGAPAAEDVLPDASCQGGRLSIAAKDVLPEAVPDWKKVDFTKHPGVECQAWLLVPANDIYEFYLPNRGTLSLDALPPRIAYSGLVNPDLLKYADPLPAEKNGLLGPIALQAGWHAVRLRVTPDKADFTIELQMRGGSMLKRDAVPAAWCAAPAAPAAQAAPAVTIAKVGQAAPGKATVSVAGTRVTLTAAGAPELNYHWSVLAAPACGTQLHPDAPAPVTFSANDTPQARETTATFTMSGDYLLRVRAGTTQVCGTADVRVTVAPVANGLALVPAHNGVLPAGYPNDIYATVQDQFGRRLPAAPAVHWQSDPVGAFTALSGDTARFRSGATPGPYKITASAAGLSASLTLTVKADEPLKLSPISTNPNSQDHTMRLTAQCITADDVSHLGITFKWLQQQGAHDPALTITTPAPQQFGPGNQSTAAVQIPSSGVYTIACTATGAAGAAATATITVKVVRKEDGTLVLPPAPRLANVTALMNQMTNMMATNVLSTAQFLWETSMDGATWQTLPETKAILHYGPVSEKDSGRFFRVTATNEAGSGVSESVKLGVRDPEGGIFVLDPAQITAPMGATSVSVTVHRQGKTVGKVVLRYMTLGRFMGAMRTKWAKAGVDYTETKGELTWEQGDATDRTITVPLLPHADAPGCGFGLFIMQTSGTCEVLNGNVGIWLPSTAEPTPPRADRLNQ